jgi:hypothetical protein
MKQARPLIHRVKSQRAWQFPDPRNCDRDLSAIDSHPLAATVIKLGTSPPPRIPGGYERGQADLRGKAGPRTPKKTCRGAEPCCRDMWERW